MSRGGSSPYCRPLIVSSVFFMFFYVVLFEIVSYCLFNSCVLLYGTWAFAPVVLFPYSSMKTMPPTAWRKTNSGRGGGAYAPFILTARWLCYFNRSAIFLPQCQVMNSKRTFFGALQGTTGVSLQSGKRLHSKIFPEEEEWRSGRLIFCAPNNRRNRNPCWWFLKPSFTIWKMKKIMYNKVQIMLV